MRNLLLLVLLVAGAWYLFSNQPQPAPPATEQTPPPPQADYSGVKTFYSPLNDPPVPASGNNYTGAAVNLGGGNVGQAVRVAPGPVTAAPAATPAEQATSSIGLGGARSR